MEVKRGPAYYEPKRAGGVNLTLGVWERIELAAKVERSSLSKVMEAVLYEHLPSAEDLRKLLPDEEQLEVGGLALAPVTQGDQVTNESPTDTDSPEPDGGATDVA